MFDLRRRQFITLLGGAAAAWPLAARGQQKIPTIGFLGVLTPQPLATQLAAFTAALNASGYVDSTSVHIEYRWAEGEYERLPGLAADLIAHPVAVLFATGGDPGALAATAASRTTPIVFLSGSDPVQLGLVNSLARPGGNATGISLIATPLAEKRIGLLRELLPNAAKLAMLVNPKFPNTEVQVHDARQASARVDMELVLVSAGIEDEFPVAFANLVDQKCDTLLVAADPFFSSQRDRIVALAAQYRVPAIYFWRELAIAGGLMSYGASLSDAYRLGGIYVARILNGDKPADLPVVQPTKFELVLNLRTARSLGLTFPPTLLATADEVIE
jgi:putative tryptophan/tyrosine transport system substrate-binding protein